MDQRAIGDEGGAQQILAFQPERITAADRLVAAGFERRHPGERFLDGHLDCLRPGRVRRRLPITFLRLLLVKRIERIGTHQLRQQAAEQVREPCQTQVE